MTKMLGNDLDRDTHVYQQVCACVSEVMDMHNGEVVVLKQFLELQIDLAFIHLFSVLPCEHRSTVNPTAADLCLAVFLPCFLLLQKFYDKMRFTPGSRNTMAHSWM